MFMFVVLFAWVSAVVTDAGFDQIGGRVAGTGNVRSEKGGKRFIIRSRHKSD
jgi:hypothetical protein